MKKYEKPMILDEELEIEDIIATSSGTFGSDPNENDTVISWGEIFPSK